MQKKYQNNQEFYILKCDISKFFYSIDKEIVYQLLEKRIKDREFLAFSKDILVQHSHKKIGIPIGNYTSQYFANIYLNELDHFIKEKLQVKYYVRYMDDFVLLLDTKEESKKILNEITIF